MPKTVTLTFFPASEPPNTDRNVLASDGDHVFTAWYYAKRRCWFDSSSDVWPGIKAWADLPKAEECVE
ncbi:MAG: hypothetical protein ABFD97_20285 [Syntrophobacter sp.]